MNSAQKIAITYGLYSGIRMIIGIYHTLYLLSTGVTIQQYSQLQFVFTLTIILSEIPIAKLSDQRSRKLSVLIGVIFTIVYYFLCLKAPNLHFLMIASVFYGLALSFVSGAADGWLINELDNNQDYAYYNGLAFKITSIGSLLFGILGYCVYKLTENYQILYTMSYILMSVVFFLFVFINERKTHHNLKPKVNIKNVFKQISSVNYVGYYFLLAGVFTVVMQIVFYYWQPIMSLNETYPNEILLACFLGVFLSQFIFSKTILAIKNLHFHKTIAWLCISAIIGFIMLYAVKFLGISFIGLLPYIATFGVLSVIPVLVQNRFVATNPQLNDVISSVMSIFSVFSRILALILFGCLSLVSKEINVINLLFIPLIFLIIYFLLILMWKRKNGEFCFK